jgi:hypothetical protein
MLLHHLPAVLNRCKIRAVRTVEEVIQVIVPLPVGYNIASRASFMATVVVLFKDKVGVLLQPWLYHRLKDLIMVHLEE